MNETLEKERKKRRKQKKRRKRAKAFFMLLGVLIVAAGAFVITVKICKPDFDFTALIPQAAVSFVKEDVLGQTTQSAVTTQPASTTTTTTVQYADYAEFSDFAFDTSKQGSQVGNILNQSGGAVTFNASYIYFSVSGSGIYRFSPAEETTSKLKGGAKNAACLNIMDDYLYYVDKDSHKLKRVIASGGDAKTIAEDVKQAYGYNGALYCVGQSGVLFSVRGDGSEKTVLYTAGEDKQIQFVGISLTRVYFTVYDSFEDERSFVTVTQTGEDRQFFRAPAKKDEIVSMQLENGFFYYYEMTDDGAYNLVRKKFGSEKEAVLLKDTSNTDYPVIYGNRLYYSQIKKGVCRAMELNMNSNEKKTMLSVANAKKDGSLAVACGYQYIFLIGRKSDGGEKVYRASCIYTSASADNMMDFKNGKWKY